MPAYLRIPAAVALALLLGPTLATPSGAQDAGAAAETAAESAQDAAPAAGGEARAELAADTVLATVNGQAVTLGNLLALVAELPEQYRELPDEMLFNAVLDQMVQQLALSGQFTQPSLAEALVLENQDRAVRAGLVVQRLLNEPVTDEELRAAYDRQFADAAPRKEYHAAHILVETEEEAQAIVDELAAGGDFEGIAREQSRDPGSAASGGDLGWFGEGMMVPEFEEAVIALQPGETSGPVESQFGWHVVRLDDTREVELPSIEEMQAQLEDQIRSQRVEAAIAQAEAEAEIDRSGAEALDPAAVRRSDLLEE